MRATDCDTKFSKINGCDYVRKLKLQFETANQYHVYYILGSDEILAHLALLSLRVDGGHYSSHNMSRNKIHIRMLYANNT